jgi:alpha-D-xyloside xylohydrolase
MRLYSENNKLYWRYNSETVCIEPWGKDSFRVRASKGNEIIDNLNWALLEPQAVECYQDISQNLAVIINGKLRAEISEGGQISFYNNNDNRLLVQEVKNKGFNVNRSYKSLAGGLNKIEVMFKAYEDEHIYGLGQHRHGFLNQKGCVVELAQNNADVSIPFMVSCRGYGFLWNNPSVGRVELGNNATRWIAEESRQIDYFITTGDSFVDIMERYSEATGKPRMLPEWAAGFWQSKLRYFTQEELLEVAREYKRRGLPLSVIVIDYFHWTAMGDWKFKQDEWPDPTAMVKELEQMGIKVLLSIWPSVNRNSENYEAMLEKGLLVKTKRGVPAINCFVDTRSEDFIYFHYYDATSEEARKFVWEKIKDNYYSHGIKVWWLDACEPEINPRDYENMLYSIGSGAEVGCIYPMMNQKTFFDGMRAEGEEDIVLLSRSAWAGSQRYGTAVWSGDIETTFESLREQVKAGLNIGMSGIPWWTTDIGGFIGGNPESEEYRELFIRWFQYGALCPLFRLHGVREPMSAKSGGPNEVWSYGEEAYEILKELLFFREKLKPYIMEQMRAAHEKGSPVMRPLFYDFPIDARCYEIEDQYMFGPDILVAPVLKQGARKREVYLPEGTGWINYWTNEKLQGGVVHDVDAPINLIPLFIKESAKL